MGDSTSPSSVRKLSMKRSPSSLSSYSLRSKGNGRVVGFHQGYEIQGCTVIEIERSIRIGM